MNIVIGLYGMMCSGKDTVADYLVEKGYRKISISEDILKPVLRTMKLKPDRMNYIKLGKSLKNFREDTLAFLVHGLINKGSDLKYVIPNIMTFKEAEFFKEQKDIKFILIKIITDQITRYERNLKRGSEKDVHELIKFKNLDVSNLTRTGLKELMHAGLEDNTIYNNTTIEELKNKIDKIMMELD
ncbi:MAG: AAA family ATPase [Candidatus Nanoarchaeia archaeon]|jgi:dephospho-CoA kinase